MPIQLCTVKGCTNEGRYCRLHQVLTFKPSAPIKKESEDRKEVNKEYRKKAKAFVKRNPKCKVCGKPSECVHHKKGRIGDNLMNEKTWLPVCLSCHKMIEENPTEAKEKGYSDSRLKKREDATVVH
jgi:hypothetical protein